MLKGILEIKPTDRAWHLPVLAGLCVGLPILAGYFTDSLADGKLASMAGLVILYIHTAQPIANRMIILMACSFGLMVSFTIGIVSGANPIAASVVLGTTAFFIHLALYYLGMTRPPGNFFFIMLASIAICMPNDLATVPHKIGMIGIGTMVSCVLGFIYSLLLLPRSGIAATTVAVPKHEYANLVESATFGVFVGLAVLAARLLKLENPYWVPMSCAAVMQGVSVRHVWQRSIQRVLGTFVGLVVTWGILSLQPSMLALCVGIIVLQIVVELLIVRNYGIAVVFITVLTIFLAESGDTLTNNPTQLMTARFFDILIGSTIGAIGGWILYNEKVHAAATRQIRRTKVIVKKRKG